MKNTSHILMIRPVDFKFNEQTAGDNKFQVFNPQNDVQKKALAEFDTFVELLKNNNINVIVINDTLQPETPDSIFPNNWVSFHEDGSIFLYPMHSANRRLERRKDIIEQLNQKFEINHLNDLSFFENQNHFLEGTGSMVLDRINKLAYACLSERTNLEVLNQFCYLSGYNAVPFHAFDENSFPIYHTNVMMCIAEKYVVVCLDSVTDKTEKIMLKEQFKATNKEVISISFKQMNHFAGNMLELRNANNESLIIMSEQAFSSLEPNQIHALEKYSKLIHSPLNTIEQNGGGSARCMLAEVNLPVR